MNRAFNQNLMHWILHWILLFSMESDVVRRILVESVIHLFIFEKTQYTNQNPMYYIGFCYLLHLIENPSNSHLKSWIFNRN